MRSRLEVSRELASSASVISDTTAAAEQLATKPHGINGAMATAAAADEAVAAVAAAEAAAAEAAAEEAAAEAAAAEATAAEAAAADVARKSASSNQVPLAPHANWQFSYYHQEEGTNREP